jgi:hypothetical protein
MTPNDLDLRFWLLDGQSSPGGRMPTIPHDWRTEAWLRNEAAEDPFYSNGGFLRLLGNCEGRTGARIRMEAWIFAQLALRVFFYGLFCVASLQVLLLVLRLY